MPYRLQILGAAATFEDFSWTHPDARVVTGLAIATEQVIGTPPPVYQPDYERWVFEQVADITHGIILEEPEISPDARDEDQVY